ncbi:hypothetical protein TNCV_2491251 [Trichonephila clavipes]|nr:hypothetical protein TNCV_2491251 [Trichonephila clavipes]
MKEGRFDLGTFRSVSKYFINYAKTIVIALSLVLVYIDITPPHTPMLVIQRIGERSIPYTWQACEQLRHFVDCVIVRFFAGPGSPMQEGGKIRSGYLPFRTRVLYRPRQNDRQRVMFGTSLYRYPTTTRTARFMGFFS